jgi:AAA15 family ATPase/GTPase
MILKSIRIKNYRSFIDSGLIPIERFMGFVGENNAGKSNIIYALQSYFSAGAGGITKKDFNKDNLEIIINCILINLSESEKKIWKSYLINGDLILEKHF